MNNTVLSVLDTNVLVYAHDQESPHHDASARLLRTASDPEAGLCVTPQNLAEFFAIVTSPKRVKNPLTTEEALAAIDRILLHPGITQLPIPVNVVARWLDLARRYAVTKQRIFDMQLVATMFGNGVKRLYTFNTEDFTAISDLELLTPD